MNKMDENELHHQQQDQVNNNNINMELLQTIDEQSTKCEEMSISTTPSPDNLRICLVGTVIDDANIILAAKSFGVPVITSETGADIISDLHWLTYFIMKDFDGPIFNAIHKSKHRIMGPPALLQAANMKEGLTSSRPIYNYSMKGVMTCFTGIRKKDELTHLVNLIHAMGGSIRKDMKSNITHLICNSSGGDKYRYAMTFRLAIVRSDWVLEAWKNRDVIDFIATDDEFSALHKVRSFEGQHVCFFGFEPDEQEHMTGILQLNGGILTDIDDPECSHVIISNTGAHFPNEILQSIPYSPSIVISTSSSSSSTLHQQQQSILNSQKQSILTTPNRIQNSNNNNAADKDGIILTSTNENDFINNYNNNISPILKSQPNECDDDDQDDEDEDVDADDGGGGIGTAICLHNIEEEDYSMNLITTTTTTMAATTTTIAATLATTANNNDNNNKISQQSINDDVNTQQQQQQQQEIFNKRKFNDDNNSFDDKSIISLDSNTNTILPLAATTMGTPSSRNSSTFFQHIAKKPKLLRTGSLTKGLRRSMSFVGLKNNPITNILRSKRRNSSIIQNDPNLSINSVTSSIMYDDTFINNMIIDPDNDNNSDEDNTDNNNINDESFQSQQSQSKSSTKTKEKRSRNLKDCFMMRNYRKTNTNNCNNNNNVDGDDCNQNYLSPIPSSLLLSFASGDKNNDKITFKTPLAPPPSISKSLFQQSFNNNTTINNNNSFNESQQQLQQPHQPTTPIRKSTLSSIFNTSNIISTVATTTTTITTTTTTATATTVNTTSSTVDHQSSDQSLAFVADKLRVVNQQIVQTIPDCKNGKTHIVKVDWFWYTIQNGYANEMDHLFGDYLESITNNTPLADRRDSLPISLKRKRKNFTEQIDKTPLGTGKRRSSVSDAGLLSVSGSFLDYTASPNNRYDNKNLDSGGIIGSCGGNESNVEHNIPKNKTMRYNHFMDLYGTESNYVGILQTIVSLFHKPLEDVTDTPDELLNKSEVKSIFSNFSVIHDVHLEMLNRFNELQFDWSEDCLIGKIILDHREGLIKAYPPYVNYFEQMKETLIQCDTQNPRFHAFLKINQAKPECGRQSLQDLMIRPVQRLPSISLLISDILKHTSKTNPDYQELEKALKAIREVMTHINEDKRKTEGRLAMFDIFNDIDNCPPDIVSSHRSFISKCIVTELSNNLSGRDDSLLLFLFTDYMEVCKLRKQRGGGLHNTKSPSINNLNATRLVAGTGTSSTTHLHHYHHNNHNHQKPYKHIKLLSLSSIPCIYDINDSPKAFALVYKDKLYSFSICDEIDKIIYLKSLCKQLAENSCRADTEQFLRSYSSQELGIDISDINLGTLKKAFNYARTRLKVTRAFSFNKTPLKRAISTASSLYDSTNSLTPATQLAQMKLASCSNINEVREDEEDEQQPRKQQQQQQTDNNTQDQQSQQQHQQHQQQSSKNHKDVLIAPMSVQPTRKAKNTTISIGSLRRL